MDIKPIIIQNTGKCIYWAQWAYYEVHWLYFYKYIVTDMIRIIFYCSMLYYILFCTLLGFIIHFYIIVGTNLSEFPRKRISNGVQTEWNLRERDFRNKHDPEDLEWTSRMIRGGHEAGGRAQGGGRAPHPREHLPYLLTWGPSPSGGFASKNNFSSLFRSVLTPSDIPFPRNTEIGKTTAILGWASG